MRSCVPPATLLAAALLSVLGGAARAQTYTVPSITASSPNLGNVVSGATGDTVFTVNAASGAVATASGTGVRLTAGSAGVTTVTVACGATNSCNNTNVAVRIGAFGSPTARARALTSFTVAAGTATIVATPTGSNPISFTLGPIGRSLSKTFTVGANFPIAGDTSGLATGSATTGFYVYVAPSGTTPTSGGTSTALARVFRPLALAKTSNLSFGRVVRPSSGSGVVNLPAATGVRSATGGTALSSPAPSRAGFTITGEGGTTISVLVPATFVMTGPGGDTLTVTTSTTASGSQTLSAASGAAGTLSFSVGGQFGMTSTTPSGAYSGTFSVEATYN